MGCYLTICLFNVFSQLQYKYVTRLMLQLNNVINELKRWKNPIEKITTKI